MPNSSPPARSPAPRAGSRHGVHRHPLDERDPLEVAAEEIGPIARIPDLEPAGLGDPKGKVLTDRRQREHDHRTHVVPRRGTAEIVEILAGEAPADRVRVTMRRGRWNPPRRPVTVVV